MDLVNRVAASDITTVDLAGLWPGGEIATFDLAPYLHRGLVLRERDFRQAMKDHDWAQYAGQHVAVTCSADAIVPTWAFMLVASRLHGVASGVGAGAPEAVRRDVFVRAIEAHDWSQYEGKPVVVKGCGNDIVPLDAFLLATQKLQGVAKKVMYGEPCSSVPVWRAPAAAPEASGVAVARPAGMKPMGVKPAGMKPAGPPRA
ncbi:MAG: DUF2480 family protein [Bacteroidota bacterium]